MRPPRPSVRARSLLHPDDDGVSPVVGTLLILGIFMMVSAGIIFVAEPQFTEMQEQAQFDTLATQMSAVAHDQKVLALTGAVGEVKRPVVTLPSAQSSLVFDRGHHVAVWVSLAGESYDDVADEDHANGTHTDFDIDGWEDLDRSFTVRNTGPDVDQVRLTLQRWNTQQWTTVVVVNNGIDGVPLSNWDNGETLTVTIPASAPALQDNVYRLQVNEVSGSTTPLIGEAWFYDQTRMVANHAGESGLRRLMVENGAVFSVRDNHFEAVSNGLVTPPNNVTGSTAFTWRLLQMNLSASGEAAGGQGSVAILLDLAQRDRWVEGAGALVARCEYAGPYGEVWANHMEAKGMRRAAHDGQEGLWFIRGTDATRNPFPFHFFYAEVNTGARTP